MYAVIFRAEIIKTDQDYYDTAEKLRQMAISEYGCNDIISVSEGTTEVTISYWDNLEQIGAWKNNAFHQSVQDKSRDHWYQRYKVQVVKIEKEYAFNAD